MDAYERAVLKEREAMRRWLEHPASTVPRLGARIEYPSADEWAESRALRAEHERCKAARLAELSRWLEAPQVTA